MGPNISGDFGHTILRLGVSSLGTTTAARSPSAAVLAREVTPGVALPAGAVAIKAAAAALAAAATTAVVATAVGSRLGSALLDNDLLAVDDVGVRVQSHIIALGSLVLDKGAVLDNLLVHILPHQDPQQARFQHTFWRLMSKYASSP